MFILKKYNEIMEFDVNKYISEPDSILIRNLLSNMRNNLIKIERDLPRAVVTEKKAQTALGNCMVCLSRKQEIEITEDMMKEKEELQSIYNKAKDNSNKLKEMNEKIQNDINILEGILV